VGQDLPTLPEQLSSPPAFSGVRVTRSLVLCVCFVDRGLSFFLWSLCCLSFFDLRILITLLVSSNSSYAIVKCISFKFTHVFNGLRVCSVLMIIDLYHCLSFLPLSVYFGLQLRINPFGIFKLFSQ
jgi:hypothetical protein